MAIFASRCREARIVMKPTDVVLDDLRHPQVLKGKTITFKNGRYQTNNQEEIDFLMAHEARPAEFDIVPDDVFAQRKEDIQVMHGAMGTAGSGPSVIEKATVETTTAAITERVMEEVDKRLTKSLGEILEVLKATQPQVPIYKAKKVFTCKVCKEPFQTGMQVGAHKREKHPELFEKKAE